MPDDILEKLALKNTENLSNHIFENNTMNTSLKDMKINDDLSNEDILNYEKRDTKKGIIDGVELCEEEISKIKHTDDIKIDEMPIFPNLSE